MLSGTVDITVNATADVAVTKVEVWLNGVPSLLDLTSPYQMPWKTTNMVDGTHTLQAKAYDVSGTVVASPLITVTVNNYSSPGPGSTSSTSTSTSTTSTSTTSTSTSSTSTSSTSTTSTSTTSAPSTSTSKPPLRPSDSTGVSITGPADGAIVSGTVDITATAGSLVGVSKVEIWIDGVASLADRTAPYQVSWKRRKWSTASTRCKPGPRSATRSLRLL